MLKIGLTGSIGSGKTTITQIFSCLNVPIYYSDIKAKELMLKSNNIKNKLINEFGSESYNNDNTINSVYLSKILFNNEEKRLKINSIIHPEVMKDFDLWTKNFPNSKYVILESAILYQTNLVNEFNAIIAVISNHNTRLQRIIKRDHINVDAAKLRIKSQESQENELLKSHYIINNNESDFLLPQVLSIHKKISNL